MQHTTPKASSKTCRDCGVDKPLAEFPSGRRCTPCRKAYDKRRYASGLIHNDTCSVCGKPVMRAPTSGAEIVCQSCRRAPKTAPDGSYYKYGQRPCEACGDLFWCGSLSARACSVACKVELGIGIRLVIADPIEARERQLERWRSQNRRRRSYGIKREPYTLAAIARRDADTCHLCTFLVDMSLSGLDPWGPTVDHVLPLALGGEDTPANVKLAHRDCNIWKGARV